MDRVVCRTCGEEHDLSNMEPSHRWPDAYLQVPESEREKRTLPAKDHCRVRDARGANERFFLRVLLPMPLIGESEPCCWGVWVEVEESTFARTIALWNDPAQGSEPPFAARFASRAPGYDDTLGLPGMVQLTGSTSVPRFTFARSVLHPLAAEQRAGVYPERVLEWLAPRFHER